MTPKPDPRDDLRRRRAQLRSLDDLLLGELEAVGAADAQMLFNEITQRLDLRKLELSQATVEEWWVDSRRRQLLAPPTAPVSPDELALSARGEERLRKQRRLNDLDPRVQLQLVVRLGSFLLPSAAVAGTYVAIADKNAAVLVYAGAALLMVIVALFFVALANIAARPLYKRLVSKSHRLTADWLEGREVKAPMRSRTLAPYATLPRLLLPVQQLPPAPTDSPTR